MLINDDHRSKTPSTCVRLIVGSRADHKFAGAGLQLIMWSSFVVSQIRELVPESQAYMDLLAFERKLDQTIMRKRLDIQEALKRPIKV